MIDHAGVAISNPEKTKKFYTAALAPLGYQLMVEAPKEHTGGRAVVGYGVPPKPDFWTHEAPPTDKVHIALRADTRAQVDAFYAAAIAAGGTDNGPPGLRPNYHESYYGAFVLDPDGHNIEAVCHAP